MQARMETLLREHDMCVMATARDDQPHCSLMAYVADEDLRHLYMLTPRGTQKFTNLETNPRVSLLVDTRSGARGPDRQRLEALTVYGVYQPTESKERRRELMARILSRHPHLHDLGAQPDMEVLSIRITSLQLLDGVSKAYVEHVEEGGRP